MKKGIRLFTLLSLTFIGVILVLATSFYLFLMRDVTKQTQTQQIDNLTTLGHELAKQEDIISALEQKQAHPLCSKNCYKSRKITIWISLF